MRVHVLPDSAALAEYAATIIDRHLEPGGNLALAGGGTPAATYRALRHVDWEPITLWLGDERWVPPDDAESNARMALAELGEDIAPSLLRIGWGPDLSPADAAARYAETLRTNIGDTSGIARPDLVLLGLGDDCHTASLFPGSTAVSVGDRDYVATWVETRQAWRLTATVPLLGRSQRILFLVQGGAKAPAVKEVLEGTGSTPAALVAAAAPRVEWVLDEAAAAELEATPLLRP